MNANPHGPNPALVRALGEADHAHYPDPTYAAVRERLAAWHGVAPGEVALSVGASDLLHRLVRAFLPTGGTLLSLYAPFGELGRAAALGRAQVEVVTEMPGVLPAGARLVYVGHPHNPTGHSLSGVELEALAQVCAASGALLILDEAYAPFVPEQGVPLAPSLVRLLSPGKAHGLVGARPAYALAAPEIVARLDNLAPAWHLPAGTAAVLAALPDAGAFLERTLPLVRRDAGALAQMLGHSGWVEHRGTPYMTLEVGDAAGVAAALLAEGVKVRNCVSYGFPDRIRVSTRLPEENGRLMEALRKVLREAKRG